MLRLLGKVFARRLPPPSDRRPFPRPGVTRRTRLELTPLEDRTVPVLSSWVGSGSFDTLTNWSVNGSTPASLPPATGK